MNVTFNHCIFTNQYHNNKNQQNLSFEGLNFSWVLKKKIPLAGDEFLSQSKRQIFQQIEKTIKNEDNKIGESAHSKVYKIKDTNYCIKLLKSENYKYKGKYSLDVSDEDKVNFIVAKLGHNATIMKQIEGKNILDCKNNPKLREEIVKLPAAAYQNLIKQIYKAYRNGMMFDWIGHNIIINTKDKTLTAIDFIPNLTDNLLFRIYSSIKRDVDLREYSEPLYTRILDAALDVIPQLEFKNPTQFKILKLEDYVNQDNLNKHIQNIKKVKPQLLKEFGTQIGKLSNLITSQKHVSQEEIMKQTQKAKQVFHHILEYE